MDIADQIYETALDGKGNLKELSVVLTNILKKVEAKRKVNALFVD